MKPHKLPAETRPHFSASSVCTAVLTLAFRSALRSSSVGPESRALSLWSNSLRCLALIAVKAAFVSPCHILHLGATPYRVSALIHRSAWNRNSANFALKLSEKGFEQRSERGFGRYIGAKAGRIVPLGHPGRPRLSPLRDFSDSFFTEFSEVRMAPVLCC
jgi:hypothetical protein